MSKHEYDKWVIDNPSLDEAFAEAKETTDAAYALDREPTPDLDELRELFKKGGRALTSRSVRRDCVNSTTGLPPS